MNINFGEFDLDLDESFKQVFSTKNHLLKCKCVFPPIDISTFKKEIKPKHHALQEKRAYHAEIALESHIIITTLPDDFISRNIYEAIFNTSLTNMRVTEMKIANEQLQFGLIGFDLKCNYDDLFLLSNSLFKSTKMLHEAYSKKPYPESSPKKIVKRELAFFCELRIHEICEWFKKFADKGLPDFTHVLEFVKMISFSVKYMNKVMVVF